MDFSKPRIALWYYISPTVGMRNDGAALFLNYNFRKILNGVDCASDHALIQNPDGNVVHIQPNEPIRFLGKFDLHILVDHGEDGIGVPIDFEVPHPNAYWIADSHLGYDYRLDRARQFDYVFASHSPSIERLIKDGIDPAKIRYMPWAAEHTCYKPYPIIEKWDWAFIGYPNNDFRIDMIDRFVKEFGLGDGKGYLGWRMTEFMGYNVLDDCAKKLSQARICVNESIKEDLNMRTFEILGCKKFLLTEEVPDLLKHFKDGVHLKTFKTIDEAVDIAKYYLAHPEERNAIAEAGHREFLANHTYEKRAKELLKICLECDVDAEPVPA